MKAMTVSDALGVILVIALLLALVFGLIIPKMGSIISEILSSQSAEVVSAQLANYMTLAGAAPYKMTIVYNPSKKFTYHIIISGGELEVIPHYTSPVYRSIPVLQTFAMSFPQVDIDGVNFFVIEKNQNDYKFLAERIKE